MKNYPKATTLSRLSFSILFLFMSHQIQAAEAPAPRHKVSKVEDLAGMRTASQQEVSDFLNHHFFDKKNDENQEIKESRLLISQSLESQTSVTLTSTSKGLKIDVLISETEGQEISQMPKRRGWQKKDHPIQIRSEKILSPFYLLRYRLKTDGGVEFQAMDVNDGEQNQGEYWISQNSATRLFSIHGELYVETLTAENGQKASEALILAFERYQEDLGASLSELSLSSCSEALN